VGVEGGGRGFGDLGVIVELSGGFGGAGDALWGWGRGKEFVGVLLWVKVGFGGAGISGLGAVVKYFHNSRKRRGEERVSAQLPNAGGPPPPARR